MPTSPLTPTRPSSTTTSRPVAVVTGASSGIGAQYAVRYAREGYDLVLVARSRPALERLAAELSVGHGVAVDVQVADLTSPDDVTALAERLATGLPRLDHLVNCAGVSPEGDLVDADDDELRRMVDLNVVAVTRLTRAALVRMRPQGHGAVVNVASVAAQVPMPHLAAYSASKAYVLALSEALYEENRRHGVRVLAVSPGDTDTPMNTGASTRKRRPEQVVDTTFRALRTARPSVTDGVATSTAATVLTRLLPRRALLRVAERVTRDKA
ncbi:SDR family NAD(P)-dependent oxidoreductase [Cellulomonas sp. Sa3CUA2]|uniref:SDR family NAD(P)-dependent oxidoreductase n=1 Tax=Cellulomonas avistercoris TaxID=2762242 RepID=A0ABR8QHP7_9CELL|nr:SDR family NAD(P)-dependent oxidoreductase [Cellulomonas avistercoris]MBD7919920.1 SDR family NAD(P)-dependent oxidoreductase [Cellulomonas avistercoris]